MLVIPVILYSSDLSCEFKFDVCFPHVDQQSNNIVKKKKTRDTS